MKVVQGMKLISEGWVKKPKGFRVRFLELVDGELITGYSPPLEVNPFDSDVTAWRYAWKLAMATQPKTDTISPGELVNVTVVDDEDTLTRYYATGKTETFNPKDI
jgi:hypothetical protein